MLAQDELRRRLVAARVLRGLSQEEISEAGATLGLGKHELARAERGNIKLTHSRLTSAAEILGLPAQWFTAATVDHLLGALDHDSLVDRLEEMQATLEAQRTDAHAIRAHLADLDRQIMKRLAENAALIDAQRSGASLQVAPDPRHQAPGT